MRVGRPLKSDNIEHSQFQLLQATEKLIIQRKKLTIRGVCQTANLSIGTFYHHFKDKDDLLGYYLTQSLPKTKNYISELNFSRSILLLYIPLLEQYERLGKEVMREFYSGNNTALSRYLGESNGKFINGTVMSECQILIEKKIKDGLLSKDIDSFQLSSDICILIKGCVFDWCISNQKKYLKETVERMLNQFLKCSYSTVE